MKKEEDEFNSTNHSITTRVSEALALLLVTIVMVFFFIKFIFY